MNSEITKIQAKLVEIFEEKKDFTGQINIEVHCKDGVVKDIYVTNRSKVEKK